MQIVDRNPVHLVGPTVSAAPTELPAVVPPLWKEVFAAHPEGTVLAELSEEPGGDTHVITVGVLADQPAGDAVPVPGGRWLHHRHEGPLSSIGETYARMFAHAAEQDLRLGRLKLDVGYLADGREDHHDLYLRLDERD
jgi:hypothetical protein